MVAALGLIVIQLPNIREWLHPGVFTTSIGEQRAVQLTDGSAIAINARSSVRVNFSDRTRDIYLDSGQAMFSVAKDAARPFRVHVGSSIVQAVGTKFDIRRRADRINVSVVEGTVQIVSGDGSISGLAAIAAATRVTAGEAVSVATAGHITAPVPINVADVSAWQQRRLVFSDNTLAEIADEFARFNRTPHLRVEGEALRARRFSGVFDADTPAALLTFLASDNSITFDRHGDEIVIMPRPVIVQSHTD
jgi:transmembrane sensor